MVHARKISKKTKKLEQNQVKAHICSVRSTSNSPLNSINGIMKSEDVLLGVGVERWMHCKSYLTLLI